MDRFLRSEWFLVLLFTTIIVVVAKDVSTCNKPSNAVTPQQEPDYWTAPSFYTENIEEGEDRQQLIYGEDLVANTSKYFGPLGSVARTSNGMNCQNCHLDAGRKPFGNNYGGVASTYPKFRERSGSIESIKRRVNDCFERSLNGKALDTASKEMLAMVAYIKWLGKYVTKGVKPKGSGITELRFLDRAASPDKGKIVYVQKCQRCHGSNGEGLKDVNNISYVYPPLWGEHSYNTGAGLYRVSRLAGYAKDNMPFDPPTTHFTPQLTDEEAWDVAAFINSQPRPAGELSKDWPNLAGKPFDHPFGPYADGFSEQQHKYGPFQPIKNEKEALAKMRSVK
jgi:thiosulfate dehydrogenase